MRSPSILPTLHAPNPTGNQKLELKNEAKRQKLAPERIALEVQQAREASMIAAQLQCEQLDKEAAEQSKKSWAALDAVSLPAEQDKDAEHDKDADHPLDTMCKAASAADPKRELVLAQARIEQASLTSSAIERARVELDRLRQATAQQVDRQVDRLRLKRDRQLDSEMDDMRPPLPTKSRPQPAASQQPGSKVGMIQVAAGRRTAPAARVVWDRVPYSSASSSSSSWQPQQPRWNHNQWQQKGKATTSASRAKAHWAVGATHED